MSTFEDLARTLDGWYHLTAEGTIIPAGGLSMQPIEQRRVGRHDIPPPPVNVSTVFLGLDHRHAPGDGRPVLFETLVSGGEHSDYMERYCTLDEARAGHQRICENLAAGRPPDWRDDS